jgi:hypothetical protein
MIDGWSTGVSTVLCIPLGKATVRMSGLCQSYDAMDLAPREPVNTMPSILFVCTGNIFRSMTAVGERSPDATREAQHMGHVVNLGITRAREIQKGANHA